jgi:hypothetical protein
MENPIDELVKHANLPEEYVNQSFLKELRDYAECPVEFRDMSCEEFAATPPGPLMQEIAKMSECSQDEEGDVH